MSEVKRVLVYGGNNCLGRACTKIFSNNGWFVVSASRDENKEANQSIFIKDCSRLNDYDIRKQILNLKHPSFDSIIYTGELFYEYKPKIFNTPSSIARHHTNNPFKCMRIARSHINNDGFVAFMGFQFSTIFYEERWFEIYKENLITYTRRLSKMTTSILTSTTILDTIENRELYKDITYPEWVNVESFAEILFLLSMYKELRPPSGSHIKIRSKDKKLSYTIA